MKTKQIFIFLLASGLVFSSCKKEDVEPEENTPTTPTTPTITTPFTAKVDGVEFVETDLTATVSSWSNTLTVEATLGNQLIRLKMPANITAGTYSFADPDAGFRAGYYNDGSSIYGAPDGSGSLVIVSNQNNEIKGTFNYTASAYAFSSGNDSYSITEGQFSVQY